MVTARQLLMEPVVQWLTAAPLWQPYDAIGERTRMRQPALLRFASDAFMDDFIALVTNAPQRLGEWYATRETWRKPAPTPPLNAPDGSAAQSAAVLSGATEDPELLQNDRPLKLYMPAHQRFYLVTASLVCRIPGLPDKMLDFSSGEQVSFVLRRHLGSQEHALVEDRWQPVAADKVQTLVPGEAQHPMFPVTYQEFSGHPRRLFAGLVPVSQREALLTAGRRTVSASPAAAASLSAPTSGLTERTDQLVTVANVDVFSPWREIISSRKKENEKITLSWAEVNQDSSERIKLRDSVDRTRDTLQTQSWYTLLDLAYFLRRHLPHVWNALYTAPNILVPSGTPGKALIDALQSATFKPETSDSATNLDILKQKLAGRAETSSATNLAQALKAVYDARAFLETTTAEYRQGDSGWPATRFLLCGLHVRDLVGDLDDKPDGSYGLLRQALSETPPDPGQRIPLVPLADTISATMADTDYQDDRFIIRCVFQRPNCPPGVRPAVVSEPTEPFRMAAYMDPDAPIRPVRIPMPVDTSPAGLRKHARNTMFVLSDTLACQVEKARALSFGDLVLSVLPWPFHKDLPNVTPDGCQDGKFDLGMLCTLSIPIITICALILLIIFVLLLDAIFKWVPYLIFCLPLPGLKAKE